MNTKKSSNYYADANVVRIIAAIVLVSLMFAACYHLTYLIFILTIDFALRAFTYLPSPVALLAKLIAQALKLKPKYIFAAPKKFAASIGFVFTLAISISSFFNNTYLALAIGAVLLVFATLEAVFNICAGCYVYNWIITPIKNKRNNLK